MSNIIFNPGEASFEIALNSEYYVDKTDLILHLNKVINTLDRFICVSRPRFFGKTVIADMLTAYYSFRESKTTIFNNKKITNKINAHNKTENWNKYLNEFNVIKLNIIDFFYDCRIGAGIKEIKNCIIEEVKDLIQNLKYTEGEKINILFQEIYKKTGRKFVFIIDEWDYVLRDKKNDKNYHKKYLNFLNNILKDKEYIALVYMTGILPIKKYEDQSTLNNFQELSMTFPLWTAKYFGFTNEEVIELCKINHGNLKNVQNLSKSEENCRFEINYENIKNWYNGYQLMDDKFNKYNIYNPYSIINAVNSGRIMNFWNKSSSYTLLSNYIQMNYNELKEDIVFLMCRQKIKINIENFQNDMVSLTSKDDVLTLLVHLGYLGYDEIKKEVFIPNKEIFQEFQNCTTSLYWTSLFEKFKAFKDHLKATWSCNDEKSSKLIENINLKLQKDEHFYFWIDDVSHKATIVGLKDKFFLNITIPQYFIVDDEKYYVDEIGYGAFYNSKIQTIIIDSDIEKIDINAYAFSECKNLETFTINTQEVTINTNAFHKSNPNMIIKGNGVPAFVKSFGENLVKEWGFKVNKDYTNITQTERKKDLFDLAKELNNHITFSGNVDQGNAAVALALRHASWGGFSRAYYQLALIIGIKDTEVLIGGDCNVSAWNYVKVDDKWYNVDVSRFDFNTYPNFTNVFFYTEIDFGKFLDDKQSFGKYNNIPAKWVVVTDLIHYQGEPGLHGVVFFDDYLRDNNLGERA